jgi:hypothetical protein
MRCYVSEARAVYEDYYHGQFSRKLAEWAIGNMMKEEGEKLSSLNHVPMERFEGIMQTNGMEVGDKMRYTAWYLYNMALADYPKTLTSDSQRCSFVVETLLDPDCCSEAVLGCFTAKMCAMGVPIHWEEYL